VLLQFTAPAFSYFYILFIFLGGQD